jgi:hypothetical protein
VRIQLIETAAHHLCVREVGAHYYKLVNVSTVFWTQFFGQLLLNENVRLTAQ